MRVHLVLLIIVSAFVHTSCLNSTLKVINLPVGKGNTIYVSPNSIMDFEINRFSMCQDFPNSSLDLLKKGRTQIRGKLVEYDHLFQLGESDTIFLTELYGSPLNQYYSEISFSNSTINLILNSTNEGMKISKTEASSRHPFIPNAIEKKNQFCFFDSDKDIVSFTTIVYRYNDQIHFQLGQGISTNLITTYLKN